MADLILSFMEAFDGRVQAHTQQHMELPCPDKNTYNQVLRLLSRTRGSDDIPQRALDVLGRMRYRYQRVPGALDCRPHAFHVNCVLLAYKEQRNDWQRAAHACRVLQEHVEDIGNDAACYVTLLKICAHDTQSSQEKELGAKVAVRLWQQNGLSNPPSHYYSHMLQAMRHLNTTNRITMFRKVFQQACERGKVNAPIVNEFLVHAKSQALLAESLPMDRVRGVTDTTESVQILLDALPEEYKKYADGSGGPRPPS